MKTLLTILLSVVCLVASVSMAQSKGSVTLGGKTLQDPKKPGQGTLEIKKNELGVGLSPKEIADLRAKLRQEVLNEQKSLMNGEIRIAGNGGDTDLMAVQRHLKVIGFVSGQGPLRFVPAVQMEQALGAEVIFTDKILMLDGIAKDAINIPVLNMVIYHRPSFREKNEIEQMRLVLHETLGLIGLDLDYSVTASISGDAWKRMESLLYWALSQDGLTQAAAQEAGARRECIETQLKEALYQLRLGSSEAQRDLLDKVLRQHFLVGETRVTSGLYILKYKSYQAMNMGLTSEVAAAMCGELPQVNACTAKLTTILSQTVMKNGGCK